MTESIQKQRKELLKKYRLGNMDEKYLNFINEVVKKGNSKALSGEDALHLVEGLKQPIVFD